MTPQKILSEVRCQTQYQYQIKLEMSNKAKPLLTIYIVLLVTSVVILYTKS